MRKVASGPSHFVSILTLLVKLVEQQYWLGAMSRLTSQLELKDNMQLLKHVPWSIKILPQHSRVRNYLRP